VHPSDRGVPRALVTGGGSGIGAAIARALAAHGTLPILVGRRETALRAVQEDIRRRGHDAMVLPWDIGNGDSAAELVERASANLGCPSILVHAAGMQYRSPAIHFPLEQWDALIDIHLRAAFCLAQAIGRGLIESGSTGSLIFIGSMTSARAGMADLVAYAAAKSGLLGLMRTLAVEWGRYGVRSNAILVGFVETEMTRDVNSLPSRQALVARAPLGPHGDPADIGSASVFLASEAARYITGTCLTVDGGWSVA